MRAQPKRRVPLQCEPLHAPLTSRECGPTATQSDERSGSRRTSPTAVVERRGAPTTQHARSLFISIIARGTTHFATTVTTRNATRIIVRFVLVYPRVQCAGSASASDRAVRLALPAQCVPKRGPGRKAVRKAVWPQKPQPIRRRLERAPRW